MITTAQSPSALDPWKHWPGDPQLEYTLPCDVAGKLSTADPYGNFAHVLDYTVFDRLLVASIADNLPCLPVRWRKPGLSKPYRVVDLVANLMLA